MAKNRYRKPRNNNRNRPRRMKSKPRKNNSKPKTVQPMQRTEEELLRIRIAQSVMERGEQYNDKAVVRPGNIRRIHDGNPRGRFGKKAA